jgi:RNA polymerase sigma factor (sigma-70 family)
MAIDADADWESRREEVQEATALRPSLLRFLGRYVGASGGAEDIAQEAYLRFIRADHVANPKAFLFTTAINLVKSAASSERRRARLKDYAHLIVADGVDTRTPERALLAADELQRITLAIANLPPVCGEVFRLHREEHLTQREIANRLGISTTAVEKSMRRAMARLSAAADGAVEDRGVRQKPSQES